MKTWHKILLCAAVLLLVVESRDILHGIRYVRGFIRREIRFHRIHEKKTNNYDNLKPLTENGDEWFVKYHFISHNGGIIEGRLHTDSREAWELSYQRGNRIIDADYEFTSDNFPVLRHGWGETLEQGSEPNPMTLSDFIDKPINFKYHAMTVRDMINFMLAHEDLYVALDSKMEAEKTFESFVSLAKEMNAENVLDRIIVSLYFTEDVKKVKEIYPFKNFALRQYGWQHNWYELAEFCVNNDIHVVNIFTFVIDDDPEGVKILSNKGIRIFAAVVNELSQMKKYRPLGITGAVSDFLSEPDIDLINHENL